MIQPGERFEVAERLLETFASSMENGCKGCTFHTTQGCTDPGHTSDCYNLDDDQWVIFKKVKK